MAGIAFWGGFASGMSKSIERNRDRKQKQDAIDDANRQAENKVIRDNEKKQYELSVATREAFNEVNEKIQKIKSGDEQMSEAEALSTVNYLQKQKIDIYKKAMDYGINIEMKDPRSIIDITKEDIGQYATVSENGEKYIIDNELARTIKDSNGQLVRQGSEVMNQVMEQDASGQWKPVKNEDGTFKYESSGVTLKKFEDVFQKKKDSTGNTNEERYVQDYLNVNLPDDATEEEISSARMKAVGEYRNMVKPTSVKEMEVKNSAVRFGNAFIEQKYGTDLNSVDFNIVAPDDRKKLGEHADIGIRMVMGTKAPDFMAEVKSLENRITSMSKSSEFIQKEIDEGKDINLFRNTATQYFSSFFGLSEDEAERVANNKTIVTDLNHQRHLLFGSVLTKGENANYIQQASSLFRTNRDLFIATKGMVKSNIGKLEEMQEKIGEDLFKMKFGNLLTDSKNKLKLLNSAETKKDTALDIAKRERDMSSMKSDPIYIRIKNKFKNKNEAWINKAYQDYKAAQ